mmetsp:Transcript_35928/g.64732  ORF Transcript_35928/g.64732 Transcript_35928/m.64732 type:complete len:110 (+) Transcript_35928:388-717(+)
MKDDVMIMSYECDVMVAAINLRAQIALYGILPPPPPLHPPLHRKTNDIDARSRRLSLHSLHWFALPTICCGPGHSLVLVRAVLARRGSGADSPGEGGDDGGGVCAIAVE